VPDLLEVKIFFISCCLARRYESNYLAGLGVSHDYDDPLQHSNSQKSVLAVVEAIIENSYGDAVEEGRQVDKVYSVLAEVLSPLGLVPLEAHAPTV